MIELETWQTYIKPKPSFSAQTLLMIDMERKASAWFISINDFSNCMTIKYNLKIV